MILQARVCTEVQKKKLWQTDDRRQNMADNYYFPPRRSPSPAEALFFSNHAFNDTSRRMPSPQVSFSDKRNSQHVRRSSLEPVFEGEIKTMDSQRHSVNHGVSSTQPKPNLAKPRAPISARTSHRVASSSSLRNSQALDESILSAEVKTNVVVSSSSAKEEQKVGRLVRYPGRLNDE